MSKKTVHVLAAALAAGALALPLTAGPASATALGSCGDVRNVSVTGGQASWNLYCSGGQITISGWVKDTEADGKCAYVKAFGGGTQMLPHAKACPKGVRTNFNWTTSGSSIDAYLYVA